MDSRRQLKIGAVIQQVFTDILSRDGKTIYGKAFVTVTNVKVTSDLSLARFYLSIYKNENPEQVVQKFNEQKFELKRKLADKLRHQLRAMPEIEFFRDDTLDYAFHMDEVFKKIREEDKAIVDSGKPKSRNRKSAVANPKSKIRNPK